MHPAHTDLSVSHVLILEMPWGKKQAGLEVRGEWGGKG
jgi:hypothetical protein